MFLRECLKSLIPTCFAAARYFFRETAVPSESQHSIVTELRAKVSEALGHENQRLLKWFSAHLVLNQVVLPSLAGARGFLPFSGSTPSQSASPERGSPSGLGSTGKKASGQLSPNYTRFPPPIPSASLPIGIRFAEETRVAVYDYLVGKAIKDCHRFDPFFMTTVLTGVLGMCDLSYLHPENAADRSLQQRRFTGRDPEAKRVIVMCQKEEQGLPFAVLVSAFLRTPNLKSSFTSDSFDPLHHTAARDGVPSKDDLVIFPEIVVSQFLEAAYPIQLWVRSWDPSLSQTSRERMADCTAYASTLFVDVSTRKVWRYDCSTKPQQQQFEDLSTTINSLSKTPTPRYSGMVAPGSSASQPPSLKSTTSGAQSSLEHTQRMRSAGATTPQSAVEVVLGDHASRLVHGVGYNTWVNNKVFPSEWVMSVIEWILQHATHLDVEVVRQGSATSTSASPNSSPSRGLLSSFRGGPKDTAPRGSTVSHSDRSVPLVTLIDATFQMLHSHAKGYRHATAMKKFGAWPQLIHFNRGVGGQLINPLAEEERMMARQSGHSIADIQARSRGAISTSRSFGGVSPFIPTLNLQRFDHQVGEEDGRVGSTVIKLVPSAPSGPPSFRSDTSLEDSYGASTPTSANTSKGQFETASVGSTEKKDAPSLRSMQKELHRHLVDFLGQSYLLHLQLLHFVDL